MFYYIYIYIIYIYFFFFSAERFLYAWSAVVLLFTLTERRHTQRTLKKKKTHVLNARETPLRLYGIHNTLYDLDTELMCVRRIVALRIDKDIRLNIFCDKPVCSSEMRKKQLFPTN